MPRTKISKKNPYHLSKDRYLELRHFCLQYPEWRKGMALLDGWKKCPEELNTRIVVGNVPSSPTEQTAIAREYLSRRIKMVEGCLGKLDQAIAPFVLEGVTKGMSYDSLRTRGCPCCREVYYQQYRLYFWVLSIERG